MHRCAISSPLLDTRSFSDMIPQMRSARDTPPPLEPEIEYRVRVGDNIKYLVISPGTFDRDTLSFPLYALPRVSFDEEWTVAHILREKTSGSLAGLAGAALEAISHSTLPTASFTVVVKTARFEWGLLNGNELAARFLAHVHEHGRIRGFVLEKLEGPFSHGDVNRYNFLITEGGVKLPDFEHLEENASPEAMKKELESLPAQLIEESGRVGGYRFHGEID
ncbi:hypothetical protein F4778DRAFT_770038 [Xylariomycetidae sp. FL2044]|nr:hypothetical protein F4778DRAFT_770038 [Xylariomycetidae sp. FL2044]